MFVSGQIMMPTESDQAPRGYLDPGMDPEYFNTYDDLGFSLKPPKFIRKAVGKISTPVKIAAGAVGAGMLTGLIPGGGVIKSAASKVKNVVTGNKKKAGTVQRIASSTAKVATDLVTATPSLVPSDQTAFQRIKADPAKSVLGIGARIKREAGRIAGQVSGTADKAAAIAAAADSAAQAGDALGARRLGDAARKLRDLAAKGQDTAANVASTINTAGAAAQGAAAGAVAGAAAEETQTGISDFWEKNKTPILLGGAALGAVVLLKGQGGNTQSWR